MKTKTARLDIEDIPQVGAELSEDELASVAGGLRIIIILHRCSSLMNGGYDYD